MGDQIEVPVIPIERGSNAERKHVNLKRRAISQLG